MAASIDNFDFTTILYGILVWIIVFLVVIIIGMILILKQK